MKILLVGETWVTSTTHYKGFNNMSTSSFGEGYSFIVDALAKENIETDHLPAHLVQSQFPSTLQKLQEYEAVLFSDIGSDSLLLADDVFFRSQKSINKLCLVRDYVKSGGGFAMIGGYMSFTGINGSAHYKGTEIEEILPIEMLCYDDRVERPEGVSIEIKTPEHPVFAGIDEDFPQFLGYNRLLAKEGECLAAANGDPFICTRDYGKGKTLAFASDLSPHWGPPEFVSWKYYPRLLGNMVRYIAG